jgi:hypothetical protein
MAGRPKGSKGSKKNKSLVHKKPSKSVPKKAAVPAVANDAADEDSTDWDAVPSDSESSEEEVVDVMEYLLDDNDYDPVNKVLYNRISIAGAFGKLHGYQRDGWHGKEGIIMQIRKRLELGRWIDIWIHPDARGELEVMIESAKKKHKGEAAACGDD